MRRTLMALAVALAAAGMTATVALSDGGGSAHFVGTPTFTDNGLTLTATAKVAGLGNLDTVVFVTATGTPTVTCTSPGGNQSPGQNPASYTVTGGSNLAANQVNGTITVSASTAAPPSITGKQGGCPNNNWRATITDVAFTNASLQIYQGQGCALIPGDGPNSSCVLVLHFP
jgi:hypothetical protein